jgi:K+-transporting ATPase A subunit
VFTERWCDLAGGTWRGFVLATAVPVLFTLFITALVVPRSPRWLVMKGRFEEAAAVLGR